MSYWFIEKYIKQQIGEKEIVVKSIDLRFQYTDNEYADAIKCYYLSLVNVKLDIIFSIFFVCIGSFFWLTGSESIINKIVIFPASILLLMLIFVIYINPKKTFRQQPKFQNEYNISFSVEGIHFQTENINSSIEWNHYLKTIENKRFFYLVYGKNMFTIVPKRSFMNDEEEALFREMVNEKIGKK